MSTETPTPLAIPDEAVARLHVCDADAHLHDRAVSCVQAISAPVVAAELRRFADQSERELDELIVNVSADTDFDNGVRDALRALRARADQLDPKET